MTEILRNASLVWSLVHCVILFMLLFKSRFSVKKTIILTSAVTAPLIIINLLILVFFGLEKLTQLMIFTCIIPSFIFFFIISENRGFRFVFTFCLVDTICYEVIVLTGMLDMWLKVPYCIVMASLRLIMFPLLELLLVKYFRKSYLDFQNLILRGWGIFSLTAIVFYALLATSSVYPSIIWSRPECFPVMILIMTLMPIMYATIFRLLIIQSKLHASDRETQILDLQMKLANERLAADSENESMLKTLRHDLRHHMVLLNDYIKSGDTEKALEHIGSISEYIDSTIPKQYCLNRVVNVTLSHFANVCDLKGIDFICELSLSRQLNVSDIDLVVIFSNALENAVNALEICDTKRIEVKGFESDGKFFFEVKNPFCGEIEFENDLPVSRRENHGYGTKSIAAIVEKHGGMYSFTVEDDIFVFRCAI
ncbi:MAG: sensor histidine kinase [Clostridia bacterium]|nr:sensor histidine kinase [Clostridia bacterium]